MTYRKRACVSDKRSAVFCEAEFYHSPHHNAMNPLRTITYTYLFMRSITFGTVATNVAD